VSAVSGGMCGKCGNVGMPGWMARGPQGPPEGLESASAMTGCFLRLSCGRRTVILR
jgi:hypothetical protein